MVLNQIAVLNDLELFKASFKNIKNRMIQTFPDYANSNTKRPFNIANTQLERLNNDVITLEAQLLAEINSSNKTIKKSNINIGISKLNYDKDNKILKVNYNVNSASDVLKIDKYDENIKDYIETFFYLFTIYLMYRNLKH
jgi:hypothetical protein